MKNSFNNFQPQIHSSSQGGCIITVPNVNSRKSVVFSNSGDSGDMTGPEVSVINGINSVRGGNDGGQSASQHGMD